MRFSLFAAGFLATLAAAESTVYKTEEVTITSCAATVTDCPAHSTVTSITSYPVTTSTVAFTNTSSSITAPYPTGPATSASLPGTAVFHSTSSALGPAVSLSVLTISTCIPTVIYSTITVTPTSSVLSTATRAPVVSGTGVISYSANATLPTATPYPSAPITANGASTLQAGSFVAAFAGLAVYIFA